MSEGMEGCQGPQPSAEHGRIQESVGEWNVSCKFFMGPDQPPMESKATETVTALGPFWTSGVFKSEMFGAPFEGRCNMGYDPFSKEYVSTWVDSMSPTLFHFRGNMDGDVLNMSGEGFDPGTGTPAGYRTTEESTPNQRVFRMYMTPQGGSEMQIMEAVYTRA